MNKVLCAVVFTAAVAGSSTSAHHSYAAYHTDRLIEIEGILEELEWINPHALLKVRTEDSRLYTAEWRGPYAMRRFGIRSDTLQKGDRLVITGNPRRDLDESGVVNLKSIRRLDDGWRWPT